MGLGFLFFPFKIISHIGFWISVLPFILSLLSHGYMGTWVLGFCSSLSLNHGSYRVLGFSFSLHSFSAFTWVYGFWVSVLPFLTTMGNIGFWVHGFWVSVLPFLKIMSNIGFWVSVLPFIVSLLSQGIWVLGFPC